MALMIGFGRCIVVLVAAIATLPLPANNPTVNLTAEVTPAEALTGQPMQISVTLTNSSDETVLLLVRDSNFVVEITSAAGTAVINAPRYTSAVLGFRDDEVPLRPESAYRRVLGVPFNDLGATPGAGWIGIPGEYAVRVLYDSDRSSRESSKWIWRGKAVSNASTVRIRPPDTGTLMDRKRQLNACVAGEVCDTLRLANFYSVVQDNSAADLLMRILSDKLYDIWLLDAIVFQSRATDAEQLRKLASRVADLSIRQQFLNAADKLDGVVRSQSASRPRAGKD